MTHVCDLSGVEEHLTAIAAERGFTLRSPFAHRHGSQEIVFRRGEGGDLWRFLTLAITELGEPQEPRCSVELYAVVENPTYAGREQVASFVKQPSELDGFLSGESFVESFRAGLREAESMSPTTLKSKDFSPPARLRAQRAGEGD